MTPTANKTIYATWPMKTPKDTYTDVQQFGVHIAKNGKVYTIFTGYHTNGHGNGHSHGLCAFYKPTVCIVDPEFVHINAILHQALADRNTKNYFDTYEKPKPTIYD